MYNFIDRVQLYPFLDAKNNRKVVNLGKRKKKEKKKIGAISNDRRKRERSFNEIQPGGNDDSSFEG